MPLFLRLIQRLFAGLNELFTFSKDLLLRLEIMHLLPELVNDLDVWAGSLQLGVYDLSL